VSNEVEQEEWVEDNRWVKDYEWLGVVYPQDVKPKSALITPLYYWDACWCSVTEEECRELFPNNGKVVHFNNTSLALAVNQLYRFKPQPLDKVSDVDYWQSCYQMHCEPVQLAQMFNWTSYAPSLFDLPSLLEQGIPAEDCLIRSIYVQYQDQFYGPIHLEVDQRDAQLLKPKEYLHRTGGQSLILNGYPFKRENIVVLDNKRFIDHRTIGSPISRVDWSLPQVTIKSVLHASKNLSGREEQERLVDRQISDLAALNSSTQALPVDASSVQRARYIVQHQLELLQNLQTLIEDLPAEHPLLEAARTLEIRQRKTEIEQAIAQQCEAEQNRLQTLQKDVESAQENLDSLNQQIKQAEQIKASFDNLESLIQKRLLPLREEPLRLLAELQLSTALPLTLFQPFIGISTDNTRSIEKSLVYQQDCFFVGDSTIITRVDRSLWTEAARRCGAKSKSAKVCAAALLAGLVPVANNPATLAILQAVAQVIAGKRIWSVPVPLTALSPLDLFGSINVEQRLFVPAAGELADILIEAQAHPDQLGIVLLEGADRVPFLPVIVPLLRHYRTLRQSMRQGEVSLASQTPLSLFHPRALAADDLYQQLSKLRWPANLLLAVTFDDEASSFSPPVMYNSWFAHIANNVETNREEDKAELKNNWQRSQEYWQVSSECWYAWEKEVFHDVVGPHDLSFPEELELWQQVFYVAIHRLGVKSNDPRGIIEQLWPQQ
jgi:hypothetical protein